MSMDMATVNAIAEAFEEGVQIMIAGVQDIMTDLVSELMSKHRAAAERLAQPTISAYADIGDDGGVGIRICFGERELIQNTALSGAMGFRLDDDSTYAHLAGDVRALIPVMSNRDYVVELLHRARPRLQNLSKEGVAA